MASRLPNYRQARGDRNRAKEQKKQERLRRREEDTLRRKADRQPESGEATSLPGEHVPDPTPPGNDPVKTASQRSRPRAAYARRATPQTLPCPSDPYFAAPSLPAGAGSRRIIR